MEATRLKVVFLTCCVITALLVDKSSAFEDAEPLIPDNYEGLPPPGYRAPDRNRAEDTIAGSDFGDVELERYKDRLLGIDNIREEDARLELTEMSVFFPGKEPVYVHLDNDKTISMKEGVTFAVAFRFNVRSDVAPGLRYHQVVTANGIPVDERTYQMGSYAPSDEPRTFKTPDLVAPEGGADVGLLYKVVSTILNDKKTYLEWEWEMIVTKN